MDREDKLYHDMSILNDAMEMLDKMRRQTETMEGSEALSEAIGSMETGIYELEDEASEF